MILGCNTDLSETDLSLSAKHEIDHCLPVIFLHFTTQVRITGNQFRNSASPG